MTPQRFYNYKKPQDWFTRNASTFGIIVSIMALFFVTAHIVSYKAFQYGYSTHSVERRLQ